VAFADTHSRPRPGCRHRQSARSGPGGRAAALMPRKPTGASLEESRAVACPSRGSSPASHWQRVPS
jgi:hypothetical protein